MLHRPEHNRRDVSIAGELNDAVRLLVEVPFTAGDVALVKRQHALWARLPPCSLREHNTSSSLSAKIALLYLFNGRCSAASNSLGNACALVKQLVASARISLSKCFDHVSVRDAHLAGRSDSYDKLRRHGWWSAGPNNMFHFAVAYARQRGFSHMLQLEPDVVPIREGWAARVACIAAISDAWVIGSALQANCTREETTGGCVEELPADIAEHVNGNALYAVGDDAFAAYLRASRHGRTARMPFDLALHMLRRRYTQMEQRRMLHRFQHSSFVLNFGTTLPEYGPVLRAQHPNSYLAHSSALSHLSATALIKQFGEHEEGRGTARAARQDRLSWLHLSTTRLDASLDLTPLHERAVRRNGLSVSLVAFIAGSRYRALSQNHVAHLRRARIVHYVLVALDRASLDWLRENDEPVLDATRLVEQAIPAAGADRFGSAAFFGINGARYRALVTILNAGVSLLVLDLDVVVLQDPIPWLLELVRRDRHELLVQSDARDGMSGLEFDPDLITRRLGLNNTTSWAYANGGTFFCRATKGTTALFRRIWDKLAASRSAPNEQDVFNRELASGPGLRWALLPPALFPNGFVYFFRPLPAEAPPLLVHANWIDGVEGKMYHLREVGLWAIEGPGMATSTERMLAIGDGVCGSEMRSFAVYRRALRDALALAHALNRSLVLPRLPVSRYGSATARSVAHYFDYTAFRRSFPHHHEHGSGDLQAGAAHVHVDVGLRDGPPATAGYKTVTDGRARPTLAGLNREQTRVLLAPWAHMRVIKLWTPYRRFDGDGDSAIDTDDFDARVGLGLLPALRLRFLAQNLYRSLHRSSGSFDCIDVSADSDYTALLTPSALSVSTAKPVHVSGNEVLEIQIMRAGAQILNASSTDGRARRMLIVSDVRPERMVEFRVHVDRELGGSRTLWMDDHVPHWYVADIDTPTERSTHARSFVEFQVCARSRHFVGSLAAPSTHAVCQMRASVAMARNKGVRKGVGIDRRCVDAFGRRMATPLRPF